MIFVFGSNLAGVHGAGAAKEAYENFDAKWGIGFGLTGRAYAIPTKDKNIETMSVDEIRPYVEEFLKYASRHFNKEFFVTAIGCGLAGHEVKDIAPMFKYAPPNCTLHRRFADYLDSEV